MSPALPPIYRDARRLLLHTEEMVRRFSRYHKYTVGTDLRRQAMDLMRQVHQAVYDRAHQAQHVRALVWRIDDYKLTLQLAFEVGALAPPGAGPSGPKPPRSQQVAAPAGEPPAHPASLSTPATSSGPQGPEVWT